jgi:hypothetical protein
MGHVGGMAVTAAGWVGQRERPRCGPSTDLRPRAPSCLLCMKTNTKHKPHQAAALEDAQGCGLVPLAHLVADPARGARLHDRLREEPPPERAWRSAVVDFCVCACMCVYLSTSVLPDRSNRACVASSICVCMYRYLSLPYLCVTDPAIDHLPASCPTTPSTPPPPTNTNSCRTRTPTSCTQSSRTCTASSAPSWPSSSRSAPTTPTSPTSKAGVVCRPQTLIYIHIVPNRRPPPGGRVGVGLVTPPHHPPM